MATLGGSPSDYWFQRPTESPLPAMQLGLQAYQAKVRNDLARKQVANDTARTMLELQKGQALLDAKLKQEQGFTELNGLLAQTAKDEAWLNPENQARFWDIASRYPQVLQGGMAQRLFDSTFGAAEESRFKADIFSLREAQVAAQLEAAQERLRIAQQNADTASESLALRELQALEKVERGEPAASISQQRLLLNDKISSLQEELNAVPRGMFSGKESKSERERIQAELKATIQQRNDLLKPRAAGAPRETAPGQSPSPAAPANAPIPMPDTKAELKSGTVYQTPRGVATWDGEKFVQ